MEDFDALVVGGGFAGMYMVHTLRKAGFTVRAFEEASDVGGTWYWNRYPGARCDVNSFDYSYSFSPEIEQAWDWSEIYAGQPEILRYAGFVADRLSLREHFRFGTKVVDARFDEATGRWTIGTDQGDRLTGRYLVMATGCLSAPKDPDIPGIGRFAGETYFTSRWPKAPVAFEGKRVGIVGTGSSGIQAITDIAKTAGELFVFQRTPTFSLPARNAPIPADQMAATKLDYRDRRRRMREALSGFELKIGTRNTFDMTAGERARAFEDAWEAGGLSVLGTFPDIMLDEKANGEVSDYFRDKIATLVEDKATAEALKPRGYPLGSRRASLDTEYYASYNRPNVHLVDLMADPIAEITPEGVRTGGATYPLDMLILATGFDAFTGALSRIDIRGRGGRRLADVWAEGPKAYLGLAVHGFPNMFMVTGPGSPSVLVNVIAAIEQHVEWLGALFVHARDSGIATIEAEAEAETKWVETVSMLADYTLFARGGSWYMGANVPGKPRVFMAYIAGLPAYRQVCEEVAGNGYAGFATAPVAATP